MGKPGKTICKVCGHNMGRSRCRVIDGAYGVRCNKCKTVYDIIIKGPWDACPASHSLQSKGDEHGEAEQSR